MIRRIVLAAVLFVFIPSIALAQDYSTGIGVRGGIFSGISYKKFVSPANAFEIAVALHRRGPYIAGMYQIHANAFDAPGLNWYYGPGANIGFYEGRYSGPWFDNDDRSYVVIGINGVLGLEYKIEEIPITIGADIIPALNITDHFGLWIGGGITLRYVF